MKLALLRHRKISKNTYISVVLSLIFLSGMYINSTTFFRLKLADYYIKTKHYDMAIITYKKILRKETLKTKPQTSNIERISDIHFTLANLLFSKNRLTESIDTLKQLAKINSTYKNIPFPGILSTTEDYRRFGLALLAVNLKDMAIEQFQKVVELEPGNPLGHYQLALVYQKQGMEEKTIAQFEKVIELTDKSIGRFVDDVPAYLSDIYYNLALRFERNGNNVEKAKDYYEKTIELEGNRAIEAYYRLKSLYKRQGRFEEAESIETKLLSLKPEYEVNHKFSDGLILLGYSLNEKEFELFNEGKIIFFWEIANQNLELNYKKEKLSNIYEIDNRLYEVKEVKNLIPNFGFEVDSIGKGFPYGWDTDIYYSPLVCHEIVSEADLLDKTQYLLLNNTIANNTNCQTHYIAVDEGNCYLQGGWIKSINGNAYLGRRWFDSEKRVMKYNYAASNIRLPSWEYYSQIVTPHSNVAYCRLWVINYKTQGKAYFDDIIFIKLELPELIKKE